MPFKDYDQEQQFLLPPSLHDFLPEGHLARVINEVVKELDLRKLYARYSDLGSPAYHPQMMLKVLFYAYALGERSSRVIAHRLKSDLAYMYLSALQCPDFRTICRFRQENLALLKDFFLQIVRLCREMGMLSLGTIALDSTKLKANASSRRTRKSGELEEEMASLDQEIESILRECEERDRLEDEEMGEEGNIYDPPEELQDKEKLRKRLREAKEKILKEKRREINLTDPDSTTMLHRHYGPEPSYNGLVAVEKENGLIVAASLTNNPADCTSFQDLLEEVEGNTGEKPRELLADSGFFSFENLEYLEEKGIEGYMPDQMKESIRKGTRRNRAYFKSEFRYDQERDCYICPEGERLPLKGINRRKGKPDLKVYQCEKGSLCPKKGECTRMKRRLLLRDPREPLMEKMRARLSTLEGRSKYQKRKAIVEPVFGDLKHNRHMGSLLLRGRRKVSGEFLLMCIAHNLRKICRHLRKERVSFRLGMAVA